MECGNVGPGAGAVRRQHCSAGALSGMRVCYSHANPHTTAAAAASSLPPCARSLLTYLLIQQFPASAKTLIFIAHMRCRCTPGAASIEVEDWDSPGSLVTLQLDPLKSAVECAEELYRQARKQRRAVDQVG